MLVGPIGPGNLRKKYRCATATNLREHLGNTPPLTGRNLQTFLPSTNPRIFLQTCGFRHSHASMVRKPSVLPRHAHGRSAPSAVTGLGGMPKDTRTRFQGVHARHQQRCRLHDGGRCNCKPSYYGVAYDRAQRKPVRTRRHLTVDTAKNARSDVQAMLDRGEAPAKRGLRMTEARRQFVMAAREGRALNKHGRRYKKKAIDVIEGRLQHDIEPALGRRRISDIRRGDVQAIVDDLTPVASGSSVRGVVNSLRALYTWAEDRDLVSHNPGARVNCRR